jgi:transposase-like protein
VSYVVLAVLSVALIRLAIAYVYPIQANWDERALRPTCRVAPRVGATATSFSGWRRKASSKGLADGLDLSRIYESAFLQLVANHVSPISEINPRRESAA